MMPVQYVIAVGLVLLFRVADPFAFKGSGVTFLFFHGQQSHPPIWARPSAFHYIHLLSAPASSALLSRQKYFRADSRQGARPPRLLPGGLRRHAGADPSAHQRASPGNAFHGHSGFETVCFAAPAAQKTEAHRTTEFDLCEWRQFAAAL